MTSHEYAARLIEMANFLKNKPEFKTDSTPHLFFWYYSEKQNFLSAVKAVGSGVKKYENDDVTFTPSGFPEISIRANRSSVCRKVQEEVWECEPLLSPAEESELQR